MIDIGLVLENALSAAADDDAIAFRPGLFDDFLGDFYGLIGIEDGVFAEFEAGGQGWIVGESAGPPGGLEVLL